MKTTMKITGILIILAMLVAIIGAFSLTASAAELSTTTIDGETYYQIDTADDLYTFASMVNGGQPSINGILTANIVVNPGTFDVEGNYTPASSETARDWTPIGSSTYSYSGTFDGAGFTVSGLYFNDSNTVNVGLFGYVASTGIVKNVTVSNSYFNARMNAGGIVGCLDKGTVENCVNNATVVSSSGNGCIGGVVGATFDSSTVKNCSNTGTVSGTTKIGGVVGIGSGTVENCYNTGTVSGTSEQIGGVIGNSDATVKNCYNIGKVSGGDTGDKVGGIVGWNGKSVQNCYNTGALSASAEYATVGGVVGYNDSGTVENCYYQADSETDSIDGTTFKTLYQFSSGEVAYLLNGSTSEGDLVWYQTIGPDDFPVFTGGRVYRTLKCTDTNTSTYYVYINTEGLQHDYSIDGFCARCNAYRPAVLTTDKYDLDGDNANDSVYEISNAGQLYWFAGLVNGTLADVAQNTSANAVLINDIAVNKGVMSAESTGARVWTPIGNNSNIYSGTFDGNGKTVSGLYFNDSEKTEIGLFGSVASTGTVKNVTVSNSYFNADRNLGGIVGYNAGGTIENCVNNNSTLLSTGTNGCIGGIVGVIANGTVTNCFNTGTVSGAMNIGGVVGINDIGTVQNCYSIGTVTGNYNVGGVVGSNYNNVTNCYYLSGTATGGIKGADAVGKAEAKTSAQFASGEVAYLLNGSTSEGTLVWGQTCGSGTPALGGNTVYRNQTGGCSENTYTYAYGNTQETAKTTHLFPENSNGFCGCGATYQSAELTIDKYDLNGDGTKDSVYEISNAGQLYWFAAQVNGGQTSINGILTADITVNPGTFDTNGNYTPKNGESARAWTPIGNNNKKYSGKFDGNGKTVSGLYANNIAYVGLFAFVGNSGEVQNVGVINSYFIGTFSGYSGGVVGYNAGSVANCYNTGTVNTGAYVGGVIGAIFNGSVKNCYNAGTVRGEGTVGGVVGGNVSGGIVTNCYYNNTVYTGNAIGNNDGTATNVEGKTPAQFASGEVAYLLNNKVTDGTQAFGQTIDTDATPVFANGGNTVYQTNCNATVFSNTVPTTKTHMAELTDAKYYGTDGKCLFCGTQAQASLTNGDVVTYYTNLADAITAAQSASGSTVTLLDSVEMSQAVTITIGNFTIDLNGKTWTEDQSKAVIIKENAIVKITDNSSSGDGKLICTKNSPTIDLSGNASLEIERGTVENSADINAVDVKDSAKLTVSGGKIISGKCDAITIENGTVVISGGTVTSNHWFTIYYFAGLLDMSAHSDPTDLVIFIDNSNVNPENFKLPAGFVFLDENLNTPVTSLETSKTYPVGVCPHKYDTNGFCSYVDIYGKVCGAYEPATSNANGYYEISNAGQLYWFADKVNNDNAHYGSANAILTKDIVVNEGVMSASTTEARVWTPIGKIIYGDGMNDTIISYTGTFNGNGKTISGLYINNISVSDVGLFGRVGTGGKIENVGVINFYFYVCDNAAGVVAFNEGTVTHCYSKGYVSGDRVVGGVVSVNYHGSVTDCYNMATVRGGKFNVGGVVGSNRGTVQNCYNTGEVSANSSVGGIVGENYGSVLYCYNTGNVSGDEYVGGLVGINLSSVQFGYNVGNVSGNSNFGSLVGLNYTNYKEYNAYISDCYYLGTEETDSFEFTSFKTSEQFASGEVAYLLGYDVWGQTLGKDGDPYPVYLTDSNIVYRYYGCDNKNYYTNDVTLDGDTIHLYGSESKYKLNEAGNGIVDFCATCGEIFGTVTISAPGGTYCGSEFTASVIKSGTLENTEVSLVYATENGKAPVNAGTYTVSVTAFGLTARAELTVAPREIIIVWGNTYFMYNGEYQAPTATAAGLLPGDTCTVTVDGAGKWGNNSYTAVATGVSNPNYKIPAYNNTCNFFIDVDGVKEIGDAASNIVDAIIPDDFTENVTNAVSDAISSIFDNLLSALYEAFAKLFN